MAHVRKPDTITFKVDEALAAALAGIENRSEFIRGAILNALDNTCPLCKGSGILSPDQKTHWEEFARLHHVQECANCHAFHIVCEADATGEHGHGESIAT